MQERPLTPLTDEPATKVAIAKSMLQAWDSRDFETVLSLFAEDGVLHSVMIEPIVGRDSIRARLSRFSNAAHRTHLRVNRIGEIDGRVFVERCDEITLEGRTTSVPVVGVFEIDDGKVKTWREYYDRRQLLAAMGVVEDFDKTAR